MKLHTIFLSVLLSLLCGCLQTLNNSSVLETKERTPCKSDSSGILEKSDIRGSETVQVPSGKQKSVVVLSSLPDQLEKDPETADKDADTDADTDKADTDKADTDKADTDKAGTDKAGTESENDYSEEDNEETSADKVLDDALDFCELAQELWEKGELEEALDALDEAYSLIIEVDTEDEPELMQQKEDLRFMISKRILEIYASRHIVVNGKHKAIPLVMNKYVEAEIEAFTVNGICKENGFFARAYRRSGKYRPYILQELEKAGVPAELSWLPLIESGFNVYALSKARALGMWQFIQSTGAKFGLKRDKYVDERLDPEKSTKAAIAYLKELHQMFGDWSTVLAAYNCGEGRILRVIRDQNVNYLDNFWDMYEHLPRETARFVPRFLATLHIVNNPEKYGLSFIEPLEPPEYETITVSRQVHLRDIAKMTGVSEKSLRDINPDLRHNLLPDYSYSLNVPDWKGELLVSKLDEIPIASTPKPKPAQKTRTVRYHRVKRGETLSSIARRYHTTVKNIRHLNKINRRGYIVAGRTLKISVKGGKSSYESEKKAPRVSKHVVRRGDSLWNIARRYGTTTREIRRLNGIRNNKLSIGQVLKIPGGKVAVSKKSRGRTYRVKRGDVPHEIAKRYNMPLNRFLRVNHLTQRSKIYPGQKLYVD